MITLFNTMELQQAEEFLVKEHCPAILATPLIELSTVDARNVEVSDLIEDFYAVFDKMPSNYILQQLSDYLLLEYIKCPTKKKTDENQFHTNSMSYRRAKKEIPLQSETIDYFNAVREYSITKKKVTQEVEH